MGIEAKDIIGLIPTALSGAKALAGLVSPRAAEAIGFGGELATFIIEAETQGLSVESVTQGVVDMSVKLVERLKFGD